MPSNNQISETQAAVKEELKDLKSKCVESYKIIKNNMTYEMLNITQDNIKEKSSLYVEGLRVAIREEETPVITDNNRITSEFLIELDEKITQVQELCAYMQGVVCDVTAETARLNTQIQKAKEVKEKQKTQQVEIQPIHMKFAKHTFKHMKSELHGLILALYPNFADQIKEILAELLQDHSEGATGYVEVTSERYAVIQLLKDMGVVTPNPYNKGEVKLAYF